MIDHIVFTHAAAAEAQEKARQEGVTIYEFLNRYLADLSASSPGFGASLTRELHVEPDFHGNRSPRADPTLCGMVSALRLSAGLADLARLYLAIAYGTRHIVESLNAKGYRISKLFACGGGTKNPVFLREHADATGCVIFLPQEPEAVLLGAAILGAVAAKAFPSILDAMGQGTGLGR